ncbi:MAG: hypothetical protein IAE64_07150 [Flavobacteriales bacterium]|nr:MAG: Signal transduction histidine kinase [Chlorobi bacterium OLB6]MBE2266008.1 hypothetical protein [Flavobacteriales bacterium]MBV6464007.1 hypothetical protein [Chlorobiota bacterium]MBW7853993.1 hypothetical protein [Candidatus Kapabacteria bacterium]MCC6331878.1 hypothetical protein [Ignavibacteria bacterium]
MLSTFLTDINSLQPTSTLSGVWGTLFEANQAVLSRDFEHGATLLEQINPTESVELGVAHAFVASRLYCLKNNSEQALSVLAEIAETVRGLGDDVQAAWHHRIGVAERLVFKFESALTHQIKARTIFQDLQRPLDEALCTGEIASLMLASGDVGTATTEYIAALDAVQKYGTIYQVAGFKVNLATTMQHAGDRDGATALYYQLLDSPPYNKPGPERAIVLHNLAINATFKDDNQESEALYREALQCLTDSDDVNYIIRLQIGLCYLDLANGKIQEARQQIQYFESIGAENNSPQISLDLGYVQLRLADLDGNIERGLQILARVKSSTEQVALTEEYALFLQVLMDDLSEQSLIQAVVKELANVQTKRLESAHESALTTIELRLKYERELAAKELERHKEQTSVIVETQEQMLKEIGITIHDSIGQDLLVALRGIERLSPLIKSDTKNDVVNVIRTALIKATESTRRLSHTLTAHHISASTLKPAIHDLVESIQITVPSLMFNKQMRGNALLLTDAIARTIYRILQTLLQNIVVHAHATHVNIQITVHANEVCCIVDDDGCGFHYHPNQVKGLGLRSVQARTSAHSGNVVIDSSPGRGTSVSIEIPFKNRY